ncbi:MAG TPA: succinyl-diaminopimelate desuccinylase [Longimicrobium sp.]|jgi:succinyl-diaminopimelate desuccinylase|nr:succinyl-diaminopimelate desuccinylase [Longimicrobium sp.]
MSDAASTDISSAALRDELAGLTLELARIPSETRHEAEIATWVQHRCTGAAGADAVTRIGNSVVCDPCHASDERKSLPAVALVGHLDTVKCAENQDYAVRDGRVYGCGASDMKAGVAVMLALLERWRALKGVRPVWIFYDAEEGPSEENGLQPVLESGVLPPLDFAFILEPTDMGLQPGCMGTMHATVTVRGTRAHSARPWQGENAVYRALPLLERFATLERRAVAFGELTFYEVFVVTQAITDNSKNVVPEALALNVNVRFAPGNTAEAAEAELRAIVGDLGEIEIADCAPSGDVHLDHPVIREWLAREKLDVRPKQAWTDVARFTSNGIAAVNFGPGETSQAHQANEWCSVESLEFCYRALARFFQAE